MSVPLHTSSHHTKNTRSYFSAVVSEHFSSFFARPSSPVPFVPTVTLQTGPNAFHALANHVFIAVERHMMGGTAERAEVCATLWLLRPEVMHDTDLSNQGPSPRQVFVNVGSFTLVHPVLLVWRLTEALGFMETLRISSVGCRAR